MVVDVAQNSAALVRPYETCFANSSAVDTYTELGFTDWAPDTIGLLLCYKDCHTVRYLIIPRRIRALAAALNKRLRFALCSSRTSCRAHSRHGNRRA